MNSPGRVGLRGYERAVDRSEGDSREPDGHGAVGVVAEPERDLLTEAVQPEAAHRRHDSLGLTAGRRGRLYAKTISRRRKSGWRSSVRAAVERTVARRSAGRPIGRLQPVYTRSCAGVSGR
jgi:hypothetical protein